MRSDVTSSSCAGLMSHAFGSLFQVSLYRRVGRPNVRVPEASSLYRMCFGLRPSSILHTYLSHRRRLRVRMANMLGMPVWDRMLAFVTWSCQVMPKSLLRLRLRKAFNLCSWQEYRVYV